ncbi:uncharacterized protein SCHCODRAFT_01056004, partial [Schizophyllum commune H4-8]|uniref:uncharacterized protein n=1 Tax=Schizophyllum commune (strain H4-8 / FGSC 9210) TaxID=578458 RepID=UPI0021601728
QVLRVARATAEKHLHQYSEFLDTLEAPAFETTQQRRRFLAKAMDFFKQEGTMYRRRGNQPPQKVILSADERLRTLKQAHE